VTYIPKDDLVRYYVENGNTRAQKWKEQLGEDLNWALSFENVKESERTKHVHRLHPYKGKFIPQLVEYFLDAHVDDFKKEVYFRPGDIVLDPFCGSGTTLVQANELGMHAVGVDISLYNAVISNVKVKEHDLNALNASIYRINKSFKSFLAGASHTLFEKELKAALSEFNNKYFPSPGFKRRVRKGEIDQLEYGRAKVQEFLPIFHQLLRKYHVGINIDPNGAFLDQWYLPSTRKDLLFLRDTIEQTGSEDSREILYIILSRTARSCRSTTHSDLATLLQPVTSPYYCQKHGKICAPLFSAFKWWDYYSKDTLKRLWAFRNLRSPTEQVCVVGDSQTIDLIEAVHQENPILAELIRHQRVKGIFTSPPYVGLINYREQHEYAYELFGFERRDEKEIGPLSKGQGADARQEYINSIARVLKHMHRYLVEDFDIFIVANDKFGLYPQIVEKAGMNIVNEFKRPVLHRTEKNKDPYSESIFHVKGK